MIEIDGTFGEGGGQILRTSLSLAAITGQAVHFVNIRAKRRKPGLMRQHLACVKATTEITCGNVSGAELNSRELTFEPGTIHGGDYRFVVSSNLLVVASTQKRRISAKVGPGRLAESAKRGSPRRICRLNNLCTTLELNEI